MQMSITLIMFVVVYFALFGAGLGYMMRLVRKGPKPTKARKPTKVVLARNAHRRVRCPPPMMNTRPRPQPDQGD
jgi:flagellar basal body-associated protein FliL